MKSALKKFFSFYLNSWWFPPMLQTVYMTTLAMLFLSRIMRPSTVGGSSILENVSGTIYWCLLAGVLASWLWLLVKKRWREFLRSVCALAILWGFSAYIVNYLLVFLGWRSG